jgi:DNA invertase Pin-like site-specific DNA recombinase
MDGIKKARELGTRFGRKPLLVAETIQQVRKLRKAGETVPEIMRQTCLSKASVYRALSAKASIYRASASSANREGCRSSSTGD